MNFPKVIAVLQSEFAKRNISFALVGGLALHALGISRTTSDIDGMVLLSDSSEIDDIMKSLGYEALQKTDDIANYVSQDWGMGRVDFLFAHRPYSESMLSRATEQALFGGRIKVLDPEDIIGLKIQAMANNPDRTHKDMGDIVMLMDLHRDRLDWKRIEEYFGLFHREKDFLELAGRYRDAQR